MTSADLSQVDLEITHQTLDQIRAQPIVRRHLISLGCREFSAEHALRMTSQDHFVLNKALRQAADGRRPEADQNVRRIGGVAL